MDRFAGVARRFEYRGEAGGVTLVDDYAHLPIEVAPQLAAAADGGWAGSSVFQPHRYSRTETCGRPSPTPSSTPIASSSPTCTPPGRRPRPGVTGKLIVNAVLDPTPTRGLPLAYLPHRAEVLPRLRATSAPATCA